MNGMGMTLRDYFAAKALQGILADERNHEGSSWVHVAESAYAVADAMVAARGQVEIRMDGAEMMPVTERGVTNGG